MPKLTNTNKLYKGSVMTGRGFSIMDKIDDQVKMDKTMNNITELPNNNKPGMEIKKLTDKIKNISIINDSDKKYKKFISLKL